jgi:hypothetical protein
MAKRRQTRRSIPFRRAPLGQRARAKPTAATVLMSSTAAGGDRR